MIISNKGWSTLLQSIIVISCMLVLVSCSDNIAGLESPSEDSVADIPLPDGTVLKGEASEKWFGASCARRAEFVVRTKQELLDAMDNVQPGQTVAIDGMIETDKEIYLYKEGITLTCYRRGSGLTAASDEFMNDVINVVAPNVTVSGLVIDSRLANVSGVVAQIGPNRDPYWPGFPVALLGSEFFNAPGAKILNNIIYQSIYAGRLLGAASVTVRNNVVYSGEGATAGLFLFGQGELNPDGTAEYPLDNSRVIGNVFYKTFPDGNPRLGAVYVAYGQNVEIRSNLMYGPWQNGIVGAAISGSNISQNAISSASNFGIWFRSNGPGVLTARTNSTISSNLISKVGTLGNPQTEGFAAGIRVGANACGVDVQSNTFFRNAANSGALFEETSGNGSYNGDPAMVVNNGNYDCDGDNVADPNVIDARRNRWR